MGTIWYPREALASGLVYLPVTAAERRFGRAALKAPLDELVVSMAPGTPVQESAAVVSTLLDRLHGGAADYTRGPARSGCGGQAA